MIDDMCIYIFCKYPPVLPERGEYSIKASLPQKFIVILAYNLITICIFVDSITNKKLPKKESLQISMNAYAYKSDEIIMIASVFIR